ncbi:MAG: TIGR00730 family Rossman fold protein [Myxococcales bacterium]
MRLCVFCGANPGARPAYRAAAEAFGALLARHGVELVYGGAAIGLMGSVADGALASGGHVIGVIPQALTSKEVVHRGLPDLRVVGSMHERKALMAELSDGFVALPGGIGTLEELFEVWTWSQLGLHRKPCALLDVHGFYGGLASFMDHVVAEGFLKPVHRTALIVESDPERLLERMRAYRPEPVTKWIEPSDS